MTPALRWALVASALVAAALAATLCASSPATAARTRSLVVYAKTTEVQFINHADDRSRGDLANPFNADTKLPPPPKANSGKKGTRAGDNALFRLKLYSDARLTKALGTAVYSCTFNFAQHSTCEVDFELRNGSLTGSGPADLVSGRFVLPVIGGTGAYLAARGQLTSTPDGKNTVRLDFLLLS